MRANASKDGPSSTLRRLVEEAIGPVDRFEEHTVPLGEALVWAVWRDDAVVAWLKRHKVKDKARREVRAYRSWLPAIGWGTPALWMASDEAPNALLTEAARGERADRATFTDAEARQVMQTLGRFLSDLHGLDVPDDDPMPLHEALPQRAEAWCLRAEDVLASDLVDAVRSAFDDPLPTSLSRVPCHRDLQLHNLLVDRTNDPLDLTVIDFGQSRTDVWLVDLVKLFPVADPERLTLRRALLDGYGRRLRPEEADVLDRLRAMHGLQTSVWAYDHGDTRGIRAGRAILENAVERWRA